VIACLRSARFTYPDSSASILVELRRHHNIKAQADNKEFVVTKRLARLRNMMLRKSFGTYREAVRYWNEQVAIIEGTGMQRRDARILGFHEEG